MRPLKQATTALLILSFLALSSGLLHPSVAFALDADAPPPPPPDFGGSSGPDIGDFDEQPDSGDFFNRGLESITSGVLSPDNCSQAGDIVESLAGVAISEGLGFLGGELGIGNTTNFNDFFGGLAEKGLKAIGVGADLAGALSGPLGMIGGSLVGGLLGGLFGGGGPDIVEGRLGKEQLTQDYDVREKERCLDPLAREASLAMLNELTGVSLDWIAEGFEGGSAGFVQNLEQRQRDVTQLEFIKFIQQYPGLHNTCEAFREGVYASIIRDFINEHYTDSGIQLSEDLLTLPPPEECALDRATGGQTAEFLSGDFTKGGWDAFNTLLTDPQSNPILSYLSSSAERDRQIEEGKKRELSQLEQGGGFKPDYRCPGGEPSGIVGFCVDENGQIIPPTVVTPASVVQRILGELVTSDVRQAETVDEFNELMGNLGEWLVISILQDGIIAASPSRRPGTGGTPGPDIGPGGGAPTAPGPSDADDIPGVPGDPTQDDNDRRERTFE